MCDTNVVHASITSQAPKDSRPFLDEWKGKKAGTEHMLKLMQSFKEVGDAKSEVCVCLLCVHVGYLQIQTQVDCFHPASVLRKRRVQESMRGGRTRVVCVSRPIGR